MSWILLHNISLSRHNRCSARPPMPKGASYDEGLGLPEGRLGRYHRQPVGQVCVVLVVNLEIVAQVRGETDIQGCRPVLGEIDLGPSDLDPADLNARLGHLVAFAPKLQGRHLSSRFLLMSEAWFSCVPAS